MTEAGARRIQGCREPGPRRYAGRELGNVLRHSDPQRALAVTTWQSPGSRSLEREGTARSRGHAGRIGVHAPRPPSRPGRRTTDRRGTDTAEGDSRSAGRTGWARDACLCGASRAGGSLDETGDRDGRWRSTRRCSTRRREPGPTHRTISATPSPYRVYASLARIDAATGDSARGAALDARRLELWITGLASSLATRSCFVSFTRDISTLAGALDGTPVKSGTDPRRAAGRPLSAALAQSGPARVTVLVRPLVRRLHAISDRHRPAAAHQYRPGRVVGRRRTRGRLNAAREQDDLRLLRIRRGSGACRQRGRRPMAASDSDLPDRPAARGHAGRDPGRHPSAAPGKRSVRDVSGAVAGHAAVRSGDVGTAAAADARARGHPSGDAGRLPVRAVPVPVRRGRPMGAPAQDRIDRLAGAAGVARAQLRHEPLRLDRPHPGVLAAARAAGVARRRRTMGRRRAGHRSADRRADDDGVDGAGAADRRVVPRPSAIRADRGAARGRVRAAVSPVCDLGLASPRVRSLWQLSGRDQGLRVDVDRLGAAHHRAHGHAAVARLGPRGGDRASGHDGRRLRRLRGGGSRRPAPAPVVRVRAAGLQHDDVVAGVVHLP